MKKPNREYKFFIVLLVLIVIEFYLILGESFFLSQKDLVIWLVYKDLDEEL